LVSNDPEVLARYEVLRATLIPQSGIIIFFAELRRANNHLHILTAAPHYSVTHDFTSGTREVRSGLTFDRHKISRNGGWSAKAKSYVASRDNLEVIPLLEEHYAVVSEFNRVALFRAGVYSNVSYRDLLRIHLARKTMSYRNSLAIILQIAIPKKLDPYEYLTRYFTEAEIQNIHSLPDHSKEQVDYLISLRDPLGLCPEDTRSQLYKLFGTL
jgi:hypothetical protein